MQPSTSPRASSNVGWSLLMWSGAVAAPVLWLMMLQTNYVVAYPACKDRSNAWLYIASITAVALILLVAVGSLIVWRAERPKLDNGPAQPDEQHDIAGANPTTLSRQLISMVSVFVSILFVLLAIGTALPPFILHPCD